jgi:hypothetical protein
MLTGAPDWRISPTMPPDPDHRATCRTQELLLALTVEDFRRVLDGTSTELVGRLQQTLGLSGRGTRRVNARLLRTQARRLDHDGARTLAGMLSDPVFTQFERAGDDPAAVDESTAAAAVARWGVRLVELAFHSMWEFGDVDTEARDRLCRLLDRLADDTETREPTSEPPESSPFGLLQLLLRTALPLDTQKGPPEREALEQAARYLIGVDPECPSWQYLQGLIEIDPVIPDVDWSATDLRVARQLGRLERLSRHDPVRWRSIVDTVPPDVTDRLVRLHEARHLVGALIDRAHGEPRRVMDLLGVVPAPFDGWEEFVEQATEQARQVDSPDDALATEALVVALEEALVRWAVAGRPDLAPTMAALTLARARCRRVRNDFAGARRLLGRLDSSTVPARLTAAVAFERALAVAEIRSPREVRFPRSERDMARLTGGLDPVRTDLVAVVDSEPENPFAHLLLGLLLHCEEDPAAATHLSIALSALEQDPDRDANLLSELRFVSGLARLRLLEPGSANGAYSSMASALAAGYEPRLDDVVTAVHALDVHGSGHIGEFLGHVRELLPRDPMALTVLAGKARDGDEECLALVEELARHQRITVAGRIDLLNAALLGAQATGDVERAERVVYALDDALVGARRNDLDEEFAYSLATLDVVQTALGHAADGLRIEVLRRTGRLEEAGVLARQLFFRAIAGSLPAEFDAEDLLLLLGELGIPDAELGDCRRLLDRRAAGRDTLIPASEQSLHVVFVGGNEIQKRYVPAVEEELRARFGDRLRIDWFLTGWRTNWATDLDRIVAAFDDAGAVVVMTFVRTQLGQTVRRRAGEHGLPWVACTGHGRDSLVRALDRAARLAARPQGRPGPARPDP